uniref:Nudix hydrolase domain-containing protein n=2 Tax=Entomoneis paludosa TaxID=265537 RepID=A0A7S3DRC8_9STRA|mmetsp:Transcript_30637/g.63989  ORF Transcript_30637/g.63989 Transcript_30637/m.63989 type:complete len:407 (+) Transcript_30637:149-1369(+)
MWLYLCWLLVLPRVLAFCYMPHHDSRKSSHCMAMAGEISHAPSRTFVDPNDGAKWRIAVACAVLNSKNQLLVGERIGKEGSWQAPQGGVDDAWEANNFVPETIAQAAARELYEEMGLKCDKDVILMNGNAVEPVRYDTSGTDNWLTKSGFQGQELHWCVFRCVNGNGDINPDEMCDLTGKNGEQAEFSKVQWMNISAVVENMWPGKRGPYEELQKAFPTIEEQWESRCNDLDFTGTWSRDASLNENVYEGLLDRGIASEKAKRGADAPYIHKWARNTLSGSCTVWNVVTYDGDDTATVRRTLDYQIGPFKELFLGEALLFNKKGGGFLERQTLYLADAESDNNVAHVTLTAIPRENGGHEESRRLLKGNKLILRRTYWPNLLESSKSEPTISTEIFLRVPEKTCKN